MKSPEEWEKVWRRRMWPEDHCQGPWGSFVDAAREIQNDALESAAEALERDAVEMASEPGASRHWETAKGLAIDAVRYAAQVVRRLKVAS